MIAKGTHCLVLGSSMAGLLTARVLSEHYDQVTLIERDRLPSGADHRKGVPQAWHAHGLLASGYRVMCELFPGWTEEALQFGALEADMGNDIQWCVGGARLLPARSGLRGLLLSRTALEASIRQRVLRLPNVSVMEQTQALGLLGDAQAVRGVRVRRRDAAGLEQCLNGELVVDASGRGSHLPAWLQSLGLAAPAEERVRIDIAYTTRLYHRQPWQLQGKLAATAGALPPALRAGVVLAQEGQRWVVSLVGYLGERPPLAHDDCVKYAESLWAPDIHRLLRDAEPASEPVTGTFPHSQRRRYERMQRFPQGLLVLGDALASFNPAYGQGMSVAALQAQLLGQCLQAGRARLAERYFPRAAALVEVPWSISVGTDLQFPQVQGPRTALGRAIGAYIASVQRAGAADATVTSAFLNVAQLCEPPSSLFKPGVVARVLRETAARRARVRHSSSPPRLSSVG